MKTAVPLVLLGLLALSSALSTSHHNTTTTTTTTTTPTTAAGANSAGTPPAAPQPCGFNVIGDVPANKDYTYEVKNVKATPIYNDQDFTVNYKPEAKPHNFFTWLGKTANFHDAFIPLGCQIGTKQDLKDICGYTATEIQKIYQARFGPDIIFKCKVPENNVALAVNYHLKIQDFKEAPLDRWSLFAGVHKYKDLNDAKNVIQTEGKKIAQESKTSKLDTLALDSELGLTSASLQGELAKAFNDNISSNFAKGVKTGTKYEVVGEGTLKVLPAGTRFVLGSIFKGTTSVKQICDHNSYVAKDNCGFNLNS